MSRELKMEREQITIRLYKDLYDELVKISKQTGLSVTALIIVTVLWNVLKPK